METIKRMDAAHDANQTALTYGSDVEYIRDEMKRLDMLIRIRMLETGGMQDAGQPTDALDSLRGLVLTEDMMMRLLDETIEGEVTLTAERIAQLQELVTAVWQLDQLIVERKTQAMASGLSLTIPTIVARLGLTSFEEQCLLVCLAPEWDGKYGKLYAYLHDDVTRKEPTVELLLRLLCSTHQERTYMRQFFAPAAPLLRHRLLEVGARGGDEARMPTLLAEPVRIDRSIAERLLGHRLPDARLEGAASILAPDEDEPSESSIALLPPGRLERMVRLLRQQRVGAHGAASARSGWQPSAPFMPDNSGFADETTSAPSAADGAERAAATAIEPVPWSNWTDAGIGPASARDGTALLPRAALLLLHGPAGTGKRALTASACRVLGARRVVARVGDLFGHPLGWREAAWRLCREAWLEEAIIVLEEADSLFEAEQPGKPAPLAELLGPLERYGLAVLLLGERDQPLSRVAAGFRGIYASLDFPLPDSASAAVLWHSLAAAYPCDASVAPDAFADKFRLTPGKIDAAFRGAWNRARLRDPEGGTIGEADLRAACYEQTNHKLSTLAERLTPRCGWEDLILPDDQSRLLRELVQQVRYRSVVYDEWGFGQKRVRGRGLNVLFHGPPGTGKTTAAEVIALELGQELYRIDLSQIVSKYIGETEKNLQRVFQEAEESCAILFFDEADAIFGKRTEVKDAHDRHANTEIAYLLQRMEAYDGITILATNLLGNLDEAFIRRMAFSILFPLPDEEQRMRIWEAMFPPSAPRGSDVDLSFLARQFSLSGGHIKNIVHTAAFFAAEQSAAIGMTHLLRAVRREMDKMGRMVRREDFGSYGPF
ncbi:ATP-binding protein [Paenibacillus sp. PR3]|uniref:ATP-binding protein n=1 Tax=Paenibacillus terricola TaxID=2763503 RepID=A0ABR8N4H2_9BACL|nr:ATP-binding protein [Paenibacillus terricola]MBD3922441.1 ATP-binding protein [Paenibacillus terricola]